MLEVVDRLIEGVKKTREVAQKIHDAELQNAVADLMLDSAQLKMEMAELRDENVQVKAELDALHKQADIRSKVEIKNGTYYLAKPVSGYSQGPFCTRCLDSDGKLITLMGPGWQPGMARGPGTIRTPDGSGYTCPECIRQSR